MRIIKPEDKILSLSHCDSDGLACQIVLANVFKNIKFSTQSFYKVDSIIQFIDLDKFDHVFITDIFPSVQKLLDRSDKFILIDHHDSSIAYHDPKKMRFNDITMCGAALTKKFIEAYYKIKLSHLDRYIYLVNDYDMWFHKDPFSKDFNMMYEMYKDMNPKIYGDGNNYMSAYRNRFMNGDVNLTQQELDFIAGKKEEFKQVYEALEIVEFQHIKGCLVINANGFINEICSDLLDSGNYRIVFLRNTKNGHISVRHNIENLNIGEFLTKNNLGGGHKKSAGMDIMDADTMTKKLLTMEKVFYANYPEVRLDS